MTNSTQCSGPSHRDDEAGRLLECLQQPFALGLGTTAGADPLGGFVDDGDNARRLAGLVQHRRVIEVHPDLLRPAVAEERQLLVAIG